MYRRADNQFPSAGEHVNYACFGSRRAGACFGGLSESGGRALPFLQFWGRHVYRVNIAYFYAAGRYREERKTASLRFLLKEVEFKKN